MEVELNTDNLRNLCRICLGEGEYNIWEHKVLCNDGAAYEGSVEAVEGKLQDVVIVEQMTVHEVLQMYNDWQHTILDFDSQLHLICKACLDELQPHYRYYRRLQTANKQLKQLYMEALQHDQSKSLENSASVIAEEQLVFTTDLQVIATMQIDTQSVASEGHVDVCAEETVKKQAKRTCATTTKLAQKRKFGKNPKIILTGGVTQLLAHAIADGNNYVSTLDGTGHISVENLPYSPQKRKRTELDFTDETALMVEETQDQEVIFHEYAEQDDAQGIEAYEIVAYEAGQEQEHVEVANGETKLENRQQEPQECGVIEGEEHQPPQQLSEENADENVVVFHEYAEQDVVQEIEAYEVVAYETGEEQERVEEEEPQECVVIDEEEEHQPTQKLSEENPPPERRQSDENAALPFATLNANDAGRSIYVCKYCPQAFTAPCFLLTHARNSHICKHCSKAFKKTSHLYAHIKEAHSQFKCEFCGKVLSSNANLKKHRIALHGSLATAQIPARVTIHVLNTTAKAVMHDEGSRDGGREETAASIGDSDECMKLEYLD